MNATTPLWLTVVLAVLAPTLTLVGVLWTQRAADRRALREADLRLHHEHEVARVERLNALYEEIIAACQEMVREGTSDPRFLALYTRALLVAPVAVQDALMRYRDELLVVDQARRDDGADAIDQAAVGLGRRMIELIEVIRADVAKPRTGKLR